MNRFIRIAIVVIILNSVPGLLYPGDPLNISMDLARESMIINNRIRLTESFLKERCRILEVQLLEKGGQMKDQLSILCELRELEKCIQDERQWAEFDLALFRYRKGIEVLKMIFEKILSLDHHFTSLNTFRDIGSLSNPNSFPEFERFKNSMKKGIKLKNKVDLPAVLDNNTLFSMGYAMVYSLFGTGGKAARSREIRDISCLLDFTLSMYSDLKIIYYETDFLSMENAGLRDNCLALFKDYTRVINYSNSLEYCRSHDDWDLIIRGLNRLEDDFAGLSVQGAENKDRKKAILGQLMFNVELLMDFAESYARFISQGELYYRKFLRILKHYEHMDSCHAALPVQYGKLESEISQSIQKFDSAYNIAELRGSKLRELMFGYPDN